MTKQRFVTLKSGLVTPAPKPAPMPLPPSRQYSPLEIRDDDQRAKAIEAFSLLWDALELSSQNSVLCPTPKETCQAHWGVWHCAAYMLLGDDAPKREVNT